MSILLGPCVRGWGVHAWGRVGNAHQLEGLRSKNAQYAQCAFGNVRLLQTVFAPQFATKNACAGRMRQPCVQMAMRASHDPKSQIRNRNFIPKSNIFP